MKLDVKKFDFKRFILINLGVIIMSCGLYFFMMPSNLAAGGVSGLSIVINRLIPKFPVGLIMLAINSILFILAFTLLGKDFGGYTLYATLFMSFALMVLERFFPLQGPLTDDLLINLIFGTLCSGVGLGIIFNQNASSGGTDIIAKILEKYFNIGIAKGLLIADFVVTLFASYVFGIRLGMYGLLGVILGSFLIDRVIAGFNAKYSLMIISDKYELINNFILEEIKRGTTIYHASGGYSKMGKSIVNVIVSREQYIKIRKFVRDNDHKAFMTVAHITEVEGEGFTFDI